MALLHNSILRGYNSIFNQIPYIQEGDKEDFMRYSLTWYKFVKSHHNDEEVNLFPKIEELLQDDTVFKETHTEHGMSRCGSTCATNPPWCWACRVGAD